MFILPENSSVPIRRGVTVLEPVMAQFQDGLISLSEFVNAVHDAGFIAETTTTFLHKEIEGLPSALLLVPGVRETFTVTYKRA